MYNFFLRRSIHYESNKIQIIPGVDGLGSVSVSGAGRVSQAQASTIYTPKADGTVVYTSAKAVIDASHIRRICDGQIHRF